MSVCASVVVVRTLCLSTWFGVGRVLSTVSALGSGGGTSSRVKFETLGVSRPFSFGVLFPVVSPFVVEAEDDDGVPCNSTAIGGIVASPSPTCGVDPESSSPP